MGYVWCVCVCVCVCFDTLIDMTVFPIKYKKGKKMNRESEKTVTLLR